MGIVSNGAHIANGGPHIVVLPANQQGLQFGLEAVHVLTKEGLHAGVLGAGAQGFLLCQATEYLRLHFWVGVLQLLRKGFDVGPHQAGVVQVHLVPLKDSKALAHLFHVVRRVN